MNYYCILCDETIKRMCKNKHFETEIHISSESSIIRRYIFLNPGFDKVDEIMRKDVIMYNKKHDQYGVRCLLKLITNKNNIKYIRITTNSILHYTHYVPKRLILKRIDRDGNNFSQVLEIRISFINSYRFMSYEHYLEQKMSMCEIKLNQILYRDSTLINLINRDLIHLLINHYDYIPFKI